MKLLSVQNYYLIDDENQKNSNLRRKNKVIPIKSGKVVNFMNYRWIVIQSLGLNYFMITLEEPVAIAPFNEYKTRQSFFPENDDNSDGYENSLIKKIVDSWYKKNIKETAYEESVVPVIIPSITLNDMKKLGWVSNGDGYTSKIKPSATIIDKEHGKKRAFVMSREDVSIEGRINGNLTELGLNYRSKMIENSLPFVWLRSPGDYFDTAVGVCMDSRSVATNYVGRMTAVVPSLVVHIPS